MKKTNLIGVFFLGLIQSQIGLAGWLDGAPYVGGGLSYTIYDNIDDVTTNADISKEWYDRQHLTKNTFGVMGFAGWTFPGSYSLEVSYADFGEFTADGYWNVGSTEYFDDITGKFTGKGIGVRYDWPESESMNIYARAGVMRWEATWDVKTFASDTAVVESSESNTNGSDLYAGVGGQYRLVSNLFLYAEAYYLDSKFDQDGFDIKQPVYAVFGGVMFRFGEIARKSGSTDKRTREVTACDPKYKEIGGVMCE